MWLLSGTRYSAPFLFTPVVFWLPGQTCESSCLIAHTALPLSPNQCCSSNKMCAKYKFPNNLCIWAQYLASASIWPQSLRTWLQALCTSLVQAGWCSFQWWSSHNVLIHSLPYALRSSPLTLHPPCHLPLLEPSSVTSPSAVPLRGKRCKTAFKLQPQNYLKGLPALLLAGLSSFAISFWSRSYPQPHPAWKGGNTVRSCFCRITWGTSHYLKYSQDFGLIKITLPFSQSWRQKVFRKVVGKLILYKLGQISVNPQRFRELE